MHAAIRSIRGDGFDVWNVCREDRHGDERPEESEQVETRALEDGFHDAHPFRLCRSRPIRRPHNQAQDRAYHCQEFAFAPAAPVIVIAENVAAFIAARLDVVPAVLNFKAQGTCHAVSLPLRRQQSNHA